MGRIHRRLELGSIDRRIGFRSIKKVSCCKPEENPTEKATPANTDK
jgi:hypothetical protein